jgi:hypothetical protein
MKRSQVTFAPALLLLFALAGATAFAQRPRVSADTTPAATPAADPKATPAVPPAPATLKAKYEGGVGGYMKKQTGTLNFDDAARRLVFRDKAGREYLSLPYDSVAAVWPDTKARRSTTGTVVTYIPLPYGANMLGYLMRNKQRYLVVQYNDPDTDVQGLTSFKLDNKQVLASAVQTLAGRAKLQQRGEGYVRKDKAAANGSTPDDK